MRGLNFSGSTCIFDSCKAFSGNASITDRSMTFSGATNISGRCYEYLQSSGSLSLVDSKVHDLVVSGSADLRRCENRGTTTASGFFTASDCPMLGMLKGAGTTTLTNCKHVFGVNAKGVLLLEDTNVGDQGVVFFGNDMKMVRSTAHSVECSSGAVLIKDSLVEKLVVKPCQNSKSFRIFGMTFFGEATRPVEQIISLVGKDCQVGLIVVDKDCVGKIVLKDGAQLPGFQGVSEISFAEIRNKFAKE